MKKNDQIETKIQKNSRKNNIHIIVSILFSVLCLAILYVSRHEILHGSLYKKANIMKLGILFVLWAAGTLMLLLSPKFGKRWNHILLILYVLTAPFFTFFCMETAIYDADMSFSGMTTKLFLYNICAVYVLEFILSAVLNNIRYGTMLSALICTVFSIVNHFVFEFRGVPIMASDLATVGTAAEVLGSYTIIFDFFSFFSLLLLFDVLVCGSVLTDGRIFPKKRYWAVGVLVMLGVSTVCTKQFVFSDYLNQQGYKMSMFRPMNSYRQYGSIVAFAGSMKYASLEEPEGYDTEKLEEITSKYVSDTTASDNEKPNVIVVVNESFADLKVLGDFETNEDYMPFIHSLQENENCITGTVYASISGGMTANTEYEILTGNSMAFLPSSSVIFQLYLKNEMPSLASQLKSEGYVGNTAIHLQNGKNYQRNKVYPLLGFDNFYDYRTTEIPFEKLRNYGSDICSYNNIIHDYEKYRQESDAPYWGYLMTIQNHGGYEYEDFEEKITLTDIDAPQMEQYLSLIKYSDEAFEYLTEYFSEVEEPTIILMTGDHQPAISEEFMNQISDQKWSQWNSEEMMRKYAVPYVIWANYKLDMDSIKEMDIQRTSMNYFPLILSEISGGGLTGFQKFQQEVRAQVPVLTGRGYWGADGKFYSLNDTESPYYELLQQYAMVQYNDLADVKNRAEDFFTLLN